MKKIRHLLSLVDDVIVVVLTLLKMNSLVIDVRVDVNGLEGAEAADEDAGVSRRLLRMLNLELVKRITIATVCNKAQRMD